MDPIRVKLANWGLYPWVDARVYSTPITRLAPLIKETSSLIARGLGRSYGDSSLNTVIWSSLNETQITEFNRETGVIRCGAGASLAHILNVTVPSGWFLPVTPGTKFITVGGAIASDVHGKNHHQSGGFCQHVHWIKLMLANGEIVMCSRSENADLFSATCGGMGLTGIILEAAFQLIPIESAYISQTQLKLPNIDAAIDAFEATREVTYSVAWIDCLATGNQLGRSILFLGEHAPSVGLSTPLAIPHKRAFRIPFYFPGFALSRWSVKLFNAVFFHRHKDGQKSTIDYDQFFYPLDKILHWNRMYGRRGFTQYQCVLPKADARNGLKEILSELAASGEGSFLAVLKLLGKEDFWLSFPMEGYTLALDIPIKPKNFELMDRLDAIVRRYGGRLYLSKDSRMSPEMMTQGYPNLEKFITVKRGVDPHHYFQSLQSKRLGIQ